MRSFGVLGCGGLVLLIAAPSCGGAEEEPAAGGNSGSGGNGGLSGSSGGTGGAGASDSGSPVPSPDASGGGNPAAGGGPSVEPPDAGATGELVLVGVGTQGLQQAFHVDTGHRLLERLVLCENPGGHADPLWRSVAHGAGKFVAVGGGFCTGYSQISSDGVNWGDRVLLDNLEDPSRGTDRYSADWLGGVAYGNGRFVAVGGNSTRVWSDDGETWQGSRYHPTAPGGDPAGFAGRRVVFGGGRFCAVGDGASYHFSTDGVDWTATETAIGRAGFGSLAHGAGGFVLVDNGFYNSSIGDFDPGAFVWVPDGSNTHTSEFDIPAGNVRGLAFGDGRFVAPQGNQVWTSSDGTTWSEACFTCCEGDYCSQQNTPSGGTAGCEMSCPSSLGDIVFADGRFLSLAEAQSQMHLYESLDGINYRWLASHDSAGRPRAIAAGRLEIELPDSNGPSLPCDPTLPLSDC